MAADRCARFRLRVSLAAGVAVRFDEDGVVQVLEAGGQGPGHRQVAQDVAAPEQVERRAAVPGLAVAQRRRRDGGVRLGRGVVGGRWPPRWRRPSGCWWYSARAAAMAASLWATVPRAAARRRWPFIWAVVPAPPRGRRPSGPTCSRAAAMAASRWATVPWGSSASAMAWVIWAVVL